MPICTGRLVMIDQGPGELIDPSPQNPARRLVQNFLGFVAAFGPVGWRRGTRSAAITGTGYLRPSFPFGCGSGSGQGGRATPTDRRSGLRRPELRSGHPSGPCRQNHHRCGGHPGAKPAGKCRLYQTSFMVALFGPGVWKKDMNSIKALVWNR